MSANLKAYSVEKEFLAGCLKGLTYSFKIKNCASQPWELGQIVKGKGSNHFKITKIEEIKIGKWGW